MLPATKDASERQRLFEKAVFRNWSFFTKRHGELVFKGVTKAEDGLVIGKLSRMRVVSLHQASEDDILRKQERDYPPSHFIVHPDRQLMLVEGGNWTGRKLRLLCNVLSEAATGFLKSEGLAVYFEPIVPKQTFWSIIERASGVYAMEFVFHAPNFFGAGKPLNAILAEEREATNMTEMRVRYANEAPNLKVPREQVSTYLSYTDDGGGSWRLEVEQNGKRKPFSSAGNALSFKEPVGEVVGLDILRSIMGRLLRHEEVEGS